MAAPAKRKVSVTLDADLVAQVEVSGDSLSARANAALRDDVERRRRQQALGALLDRLAAERGPLDTSEDESEVRRYMRLLGGPYDVGRAARISSRRWWDLR